MIKGKEKPLMRGEKFIVGSQEFSILSDFVKRLEKHITC